MLQQKQAPTLGTYRILTQLKQNAFGTLYYGMEEDKAILLQTIGPEISNNENFIVRFELLKTILPTINHPNLLKILSFGMERNIYYIVKEIPSNDPPSLRTLADFHPSETPDRHTTLQIIFEGIANGLSALENIQNHY